MYSKIVREKEGNFDKGQPIKKDKKCKTSTESQIHEAK